MKTKSKYFILICALLLLASCISGCAVGQPAGSETVGTVGDPFTKPSSPAAQGTQPNSNGSGSNSGYYIVGIDKTPQGEPGNYYYPYDGGEMRISFSAEGGGFPYGNRIAYLLFLDGIPQPYRTEQNGEYCYMHIITIPEDGSVLKDAFCFIPVTGQKGDELELFAVPIWQSEDYNYEGDAFRMPHTITGGEGYCIRLNETPPPSVLPVIPERQFTYSLSYTDMTEKDIKGWSEEDLRERISTSFTVNGKPQTIEYGVTKEDAVSLRFTMYGYPAAQYGFVVMVDNEPLYIDPEHLYIQNESGKKLTVEIELNLSDFDGSQAIAAFAVPRYNTQKVTHNSRELKAYVKFVLLARSQV